MYGRRVQITFMWLRMVISDYDNEYLGSIKRGNFRERFCDI